MDITRILSIFYEEIKNGAIKGSDLSDLASEGLIEAIGAVTVARIFIFYVISYVFFPNGNSTCLVFWQIMSSKSKMWPL